MRPYDASRWKKSKLRRIWTRRARREAATGWARMGAMGGLRCVAFGLVVACGAGYKWGVYETYGQEKLSFSELYMYGTDRGPWPFARGASYVAADVKCTLNSAHARANVSVMALTSAEELELGDVDLCAPSLPAEHSARKTFEVTADAVTHVDVSFDVEESGLQYLALQVCDAWTPVLLKIDGSIVFRNPYGFLPAMYFGFLPFEGARFVAFLLFNLYFCALLLKHRATAVPLHGAILVATGVACAEAGVWFASYLAMNATGQPLCCPFPKHVIAAMSLEFLRRTLTRVLLLVVSLGYGLVRDRLTGREGLGVALLLLGYLVASIAATVTKVREASDVRGGGAQSTTSDLPVLFFDLVFLVWIYLALVHTMDTLKETGQSYKLGMYARLSYTIGAFVALVSVLTAVIFASRLGVFEWPWQLYWLQTVSLEILNFAVIAAVSVIWRPTESSRLLVTMQQLSTVDGAGPASAADDDDEGGLELAETESTMV